MVRFQKAVVRSQPMPVAGLVLALLLGLGGCEKAPETSADGQMQPPSAPAGSGSAESAPAKVAAEGAASAGTRPAGASPADTGNQDAGAGSTMTPEEISRHFKVKTTDAAKAAVEAVEAAGDKTERAVDEATR